MSTEHTPLKIFADKQQPRKAPLPYNNRTNPRPKQKAVWQTIKERKPAFKRDVHNLINSCIATNAKPTFADFEDVIAYWTLVGTFYLDIDK